MWFWARETSFVSPFLSLTRECCRSSDASLAFTGQEQIIHLILSPSFLALDVLWYEGPLLIPFRVMRKKKKKLKTDDNWETKVQGQPIVTIWLMRKTWSSRFHWIHYLAGANIAIWQIIQTPIPTNKSASKCMRAIAESVADGSVIDIAITVMTNDLPRRLPHSTSLEMGKGSEAKDEKCIWLTLTSI